MAHKILVFTPGHPPAFAHTIPLVFLARIWVFLHEDHLARMNKRIVRKVPVSTRRKQLTQDGEYYNTCYLRLC